MKKQQNQPSLQQSLTMDFYTTAMRVKAGAKISFNANKLTWQTFGYGGTYNNYTGQYAYSRINITATQQVRIRVRNVYERIYYGTDNTNINGSTGDTGWVTARQSGNDYFYQYSFQFTIPTDGTYELYIDWKGANPNIPNTTQKWKLFNFVGTCELTNTVSINTKIGTDGIRCITPKSELWSSQDQMVMAYNHNSNLYGNGYKWSGFKVGPQGATKVFGSAMNSITGYDSVSQLITVDNNATNNDRTNNVCKWNWEFAWENSDWRAAFVYNHNTYDVMPKYVVLSNITSGYNSKDAFFAFTYYTSDRLPIGLEVVIINHTGRTLHIVTKVAQNGSLESKLYTRNSTSTTNRISLENGCVTSFVHIGDNYWKQLHYI